MFALLSVYNAVLLVVLEFRRRGISQKLMSPLGISSSHAGHTSPAFTYHRPSSRSESTASTTFSTAGERTIQYDVQILNI